MEYARNAVAGSALGQMGGNLGGMNQINPIDKPRLPQQLDQLEKVLAECHQLTSNVESAASRLLGAVPEDAAKTSGRPPAGSLDQRLAELIGVAEALVHRLGSASQRFNSAV